MEMMTRRYRAAMVEWMEQAETVERLAWWFVRYATDPDFQHAEDQRAIEATDGNVSPLEAHLWSLLDATGRTTLPWEEPVAETRVRTTLSAGSLARLAHHDMPAGHPVASWTLHTRGGVSPHRRTRR